MPLLLSLVVVVALPTIDVVNRVVGDASVVDGDPAALDEATRIQLHLRYVLDLLHMNPPEGLTSTQRQKREEALDHLAAYAARGEFPRRTDDGYRGRRPRFIDDRGVHCAVGQLMKDAGDDDLARAVDGEFEYAFVDDIDDVRVVDWATAHGFTVRELAMIQPSYSAPPTADEVKADLTRAANRIGLLCAAETPWQASVDLDVVGNDRGDVAVTAASDGAFATCVAAHAPPQGGGAWDEQPKPFRARLTLKPKSPAAQLTTALGNLKQPNDSCHRRPGALVNRVKVHAESDATGLRTTLETEPKNDDVAACLGETVKRVLSPFSKGQWKLKEDVTFTLRSALSESVQQNLPQFLRAASGRCSGDLGTPPQPLPKKVRARVRGVVDAEAFAVDVDATPKNAAFQACTKEKVSADLASSASTQLASGRYFRIDEAVDVRGEADVETAADQEKRLRDLMIQMHQRD